MNSKLKRKELPCMLKKMFISVLCVALTLTAIVQIAAAAGGASEMEKKYYKENGKFEISSGQNYFFYGADFFERRNNPGDLDVDLYDINEKTAKTIAGVIFEKLYGADFFKDKAVGVKEYKEQGIIVVSIAIKGQWPEGPWWAISIDTKNGKIVRIWSRDDGTMTGKLAIDPRMALDIADSIFEQNFGGEKFYEKHDYFIVDEIENTNIIVVARMLDDTDIDGGGITLALDRKTGKILKVWAGE